MFQSIILYNLDQSLKRETSINNYINFDLYFAKKIFEKKNEEKDIKALCLILFLLKQYPESIDIALNYKFSDLITLLPTLLYKSLKNILRSR